MKQIVNDRKQLTGEAKMKLLHHLVMHADEYDVDRSYDEIETLERELYRDIEMEAVDKLCDALAECEKNNNSDESEKVISELLELYIPEFVNKRQEDGSASSSSSSSSTNNDKDEKKKKKNKEEDEDPSLREVESIDHPISATPQREVTEEYLQEKRAAIEKMLNENKHLTQRQRSELLQLLCRYLDCFSLLERTWKGRHVTHEIITGTNRPFRESTAYLQSVGTRNH